MLSYTQLHKQKRIDLVKCVPLNMPLTLSIDPTNACNYKCKYCFHSVKNYRELCGGYYTLKIDDAQKICNQIMELGHLKSIKFYGFGEPLLNKSLPEIIGIFTRNNTADRYELTTNGSLLNDDISYRLIKNGLNYLRISMVGGTTKDHQNRSGSKTTLDDIKNKIIKFKKIREREKNERVFICIKMLKTGNNEEENFFLKYFDNVADECFIDDVHNFTSQYFDVRKSVGIEPYKSNIDICPYPFYNLCIHANLDVSPCCVDSFHSLILGNMNTSTLLQIWNSKVLHELQLSLLKRNFANDCICKNCESQTYLVDDLSTLSPEEYKHRLDNIFYYKNDIKL